MYFYNFFRIDFTDCLGRTRKCHKSDLDLYMKRDHDLMKVLSKDQDNKNENEVRKILKSILILLKFIMNRM